MKSELAYDNLLYECELIYESLVIRKTTIRLASEELGIPKSTIHYRIHNIIKRADPQSYHEIEARLAYNRLYRNKSRKNWRNTYETII